MRLSVLIAVLGLTALPARAADEDAGATEADENRLPRVDELVPGITPDLPQIDIGLQREVPFPDAADILKAMREIPPLQRPNESEPERSLNRDQ